MRSKLKVLTRTILLTLSILSLYIIAAERVASGEELGSVSAGKSQASLCKEVSKMIEDETIYNHMPEAIPFDPRGFKYLNLDIDGDGIADKVTVSSGEEGSYLWVRLSGGGEYDLDRDGYIMLIKFRRRLYALVTYWKWDRHADGSKTGRITGRRLYLLTRTEAELVCDEEDLERR